VQDDTVHIRSAVKADLPQITKLWLEMMTYHTRFDALFTVADDGVEKMRQYVRDLMGSKDARVIVADEGGDLLGFAICMFRNYPPVLKKKSCGFISDMAVTAERRRAGLGSQLLEACLEWFRAKGMDRVELSVATGNVVGSNFWRKQGFIEYMHLMQRDIGS
jgi:ribosomal protein S18 acetylase RimI-like enzyme